MQREQQIWFIGGGETFASREKYLQWIEGTYTDWVTNPKKIGDWKGWIRDGLADTHDTVKIPMPDTTNADYEAWKRVFEAFCDTLDTNLPLSIVGHSLGGIFLAKYLAENTLPCILQSLHLVAPVWTHPQSELQNTASFSFDPDALKNITPQCRNIHIWASRDDDIVDYEDAQKYHTRLQGSHLHSFDDRGHFLGSHFVELFTCLLVP